MGRAFTVLAVSFVPAMFALLLGATASVIPTPAVAACIVTGTGTLGALNSNDSVTCDTNAPNPETNRILANTGTTNVTVTINNGSGVSTDGVSAVVIRSTSTATNNGAISTINANAFGINISGGTGSTATNNGTIATTGNGAIGMGMSGGSSIVNTATITTQGTSSHGIQLSGSTNMSATNSGAVTVNGTTAHGVNLAPGFNGTATFVNQAGGTVTSVLGQAVNSAINVVGTARVENYGTLTTNVVGGTAVNATQLVIGSTSVINGLAVGLGGSAQFGLGGTVDSSFNLVNIGPAAQFRSFSSYRKENTSTWTLTGTATTTQTWTVFGGGLTLSGVMTGRLRGDATATGATITLTNTAVLTPDSDAVIVNGPLGHIINQSVLTYATSNFDALKAVGASSDIDNSGTITLTGSGSDAISLQGDGTSATNSGTISVGANAYGVFMTQSGSATFTNTATGTVTSTGFEAVGGGLGNDTVINHGTITSNVLPAGSAINLNLGDDVVTLGATSIVNGNIVGAGGTDTINLLMATNKIEDSSFDHVEAFTIDDNATWTLSGALNATTGVTFTTDPGSTLTFSGVISSTSGAPPAVDPIIGTLTKNGAGALVLSGANTYVGATTVNAGLLQVSGGAAIPDTGAVSLTGGTFQLLASETIGSLAATAGTVAVGANTLTLGGNNGSTAFAGALTGTGAIVKQGTGTWTVTGAQAFSGSTTIDAGRVEVGTTAVTGSMGGLFQVNSGGALGGAGSVGATTVANGGTLVGVAAQTLTASALTLNDTSNLNVALGAPNTTPLFQVNGNLIADGQLNVTDAGGFALGTYRLFNYTGALTYNGIVVSSVPAGSNPGDWGIDFLTPGQINLVAAGGPGNQYWDGANMAPGGVADGRGGNGTWNAGNTNWTNQAGTLNAPWAGMRAVFAGTAGTVSVVGEQMFTGLRFQNAAPAFTYTLTPGAGGSLRTDAAGTEIEVVQNAGVGADVAVLFVPVTGTGSIVKMGGGQLTLAAANSYSGGTRVIDGTLNVLVNGGLSTGPVVIDGTGTPVQRPSINYTSPLNPVHGGSNTISVQSGDLFFNNNTTAGSLAITAGNDSDVWFNEGSAAGTSTITVNNNADVFFRGASEARGATVINNAGGDVNISTASAPGVCSCVALGSVSGGGAIAIVDGTLITGALGLNEEISGAIVGGGGLTKEGAGKLILSGNNIYAGVTTVAAGVLVVNGSIAPPSVVNVLNGGTLKGTGTLVPTTIMAGGVHAPGASIGTQTVMGNYVLGGSLQVELNPTAADKVIVTGDVTLTGSTLDVIEETQFGWQQTQSFTIIDNQGPNAVIGQFASVRNVYAFLTPTVSYTGDDGNNVVLSIVRNQIAFPTAGLTPNQQAAGAGAESTGPGSAVYRALVVLPAAAVPAAFDQISGEIHASIKGALARDERFLREAIVQRTHKIFEDQDELGAWLQAYGAMERRAGDGNAAAIGVGTGGLLFGGDGVGDNGWYVGIAGGIGRTTFSVPDRNGTGISDNAHIAAYTAGSLQGVVLRLGAGVTQHSIQTTRMPAFQGFGETLAARYDTTTVQVFGQAGYPIDVAGLTIEPFVGLAGIFHHSDGFAETGGVSALTTLASGYSMAIASVGVRVSDTFQLSNGMEVEAFGSVAWRQTLGTTPTSTHAFADGQPFTVAAAPLNGAALNLELGAGIRFNDTARFDLSYSAQFSAGTTSHAAKATLHIAF